jgi:hypothetical protein
MNPRQLLCTTAAILVFGLPSVAGSQPDQKDQGAGAEKKPVKTEQARPAQHQAPARSERQARPAAQNHGQQPAAQNHAQRPAAQGRPNQSATPTARRQSPARNQPQQSTARRTPVPSPTRSPQQRIAVPGRNRLTPPPRQVVQTPVASRPAAPRVEQRAIWPRYRAQSWNTQHRTWGQRGGYRGYRIPSARFSLYFGRPHRYHLSNFNVRIVDAYPQFYADGFWFTILDPVPEYWDSEWYDTDYVTIIQSEDGYYLLNEAYPDAALAIDVHL